MENFVKNVKSLAELHFLLIAVFFLMPWIPATAENPTYQRARTGQVTMSDNLLFFASGTIPVGASYTFKITIEQNYFSLATSGSQFNVGFSIDPFFVSGQVPQYQISGPFKYIAMLPGESLSLYLEKPLGSYVSLVNVGTGSLTWRYVATGRADDLTGIIR